MARGNVTWRSWGPALFEEAKAGRRPVLLLATTFWAEGSERAPSALASEGAAALLRERVIPAWVDADRQPEVASRYGLADFPSCALLGPEGALLCRFDPGACDRLKDLLEAAAVIAEFKGACACGSLESFVLSPSRQGGGALERGMEALETIRDKVDAALRPESELPGAVLSADLSLLIRFLYYFGRYTGSKEALERSLAALHRVAHSALYDPVEGGFFGICGPQGRRTYKRLDENARWLLLALEVSREPEGHFALPLARGILHYLQSRLATPAGAFLGAQGPDPGYYELSAEERRRVSPPAVDDTVYLGGNALAISAFAEGWRLFGEEAFLNLAMGARRFVRENLTGPDGTLAHCFGRSPEGAASLEAAAEMARAEFALYRATLAPEHLRVAGDLARAVAARLQGSLPSGVAAPPASPRVPGAPSFSKMEFEGGVRACELLIHASAQLDDEALAGPARSALAALLEGSASSLASQALLGSSLLAALYPVAVLEVVTDGSEGQRRQALGKLNRMNLLHTVVSIHSPSKGESMMTLPRMIGRCGSQRREIPLGPAAGEGR